MGDRKIGLPGSTPHPGALISDVGTRLDKSVGVIKTMVRYALYWTDGYCYRDD